MLHDCPAMNRIQSSDFHLKGQGQCQAEGTPQDPGHQTHRALFPTPEAAIGGWGTKNLTADKKGKADLKPHKSASY
jgi:hypothetical protein